MKNTFCCLLALFLFFTSSCTKQDENPNITSGVGTLIAQIRNEGIYFEALLPHSPLKGALLTLRSGEQIIAQDSSDVTGLICIPNIPVGSYQAEISYKEAEKLTFDVTIREKEVTTLKSPFFDCVFLPETKIEKKQWTAIHFANLCDLQIEKDVLSDIRMIEKHGGSGDQVNHIVYTPATGDYSIPSSLRYLLPPKFDIADEELYGDAMPQLLSPAYIYDNYSYSLADPGDYKLLERSIVELCKLFPSDSIMLSIYDHGSGIDFVTPNDSGGSHTHTRSISGNTTTNKEITMPQLREVLTNVRKQGYRVDMLVLSACTMASFEVGYELKDCGLSYIVASEPQAMGIHFGAKTWVEEFSAGTISGAEACRRIVRGLNDDNVFALWDMSRFNELTALFNEFAKKVARLDASVLNPVIAKSVKVTSGGTPPELTYSCYDIADFAKNVSEADFTDSEDLKASAKQLYDFLAVAKPGNFISEFHNPWSGSYTRMRGIGVLLRAPDHPYAGHNQTVYRAHKYYLDGNTDWDIFLCGLD